MTGEIIPCPVSPPSSPEEVAYHEAGHVVIGRAMGLELIDVDTYPDGVGGFGHTNFKGVSWFHPERFHATGSPLDERHRSFIDAVVTTFMAGAAAEAKKARRINADAGAYDVDSVMREWLVHEGAGGAERLRQLTARAERLVNEETAWSAIERVASGLIAKGRLTADEAARLAEGG